ncbi:YfiR family protein [Phenylobacterium soli]|uniref:YfiR family protein n=1 Tax=Phenylobacterium soli TaxID=2170551 RepID=A0A328AN15_9CAUL|nr:YfiR family protein [Phenylobacterium soli]RAK55937.1 hypothetical protein DJ017_16185 [Phenylobacterium soli]
MRRPRTVAAARNWRLAAALVVALLFGAPAAAQTEYQVKGAMLYNIARFVDWPQTRRGQTSVQLCVLGSDPFGPALDAFDGRPVGQGVLKIRRVTRTEETGLCNMLFIPGSEATRLPGVLAALHGRPVLTVSETPGAAERGAVLNLFLEQSRVRFEINIDAAQRSGLTISSQLLKLARITHDRT